MNRFLARVILAVVAMLVLSCIAAALLTRFIPVNQIELGQLALAFSVCALLAAVIGRFWPMGVKQVAEPEPEQLPEEEPEQQEAPQGLSPRQLAMEAYDRSMRELPLVMDAVSVPVMSQLFYPDVKLLNHYWWTQQDSFLLFPRKDEVEKLAEGIENVGLFEQMLRPLRIKRGSIQYYVQIPAPEGVAALYLLRYRDENGAPLAVVLGPSAERVLGDLLPGAALEVQLERQYPRTSQQIEDIRGKLEELKELWLYKLITEEEYAEKKAELIVKL